MLNIIKSTDYDSVIADEFEVLVDPSPASGAPPAIGLMVTPVDGAPFIMPIDFETAAEISGMILRTLSTVAPHLLVKRLQREMI
jgi:hypothetical protein